MNQLANTLKLIKAVQKPNGAVEEMFCRIFGKAIVASDSLVTVSHPFELDITAAPHTATLLEAVKRSKNVAAMTEDRSNNTLVVHGDVNVNVPCIDPNSLPDMVADRPRWTIDNSVIGAIVSCADAIIDSNKLSDIVCLEQGSALASNANDAIQIYYGFAIGKYLLPRHAAKILSKWESKNCVMFGFSESSITFWFDDGAWVKCQLYPNTVEYPDVANILNKYEYGKQYEVDAFFFKSLKSVSRFTDKYASIESNKLMCHKQDTWTAQTKIDAPDSGIFELEAMLSLAGIASSFNFVNNEKVITWLGENSRGVISNYLRGK